MVNKIATATRSVLRYFFEITIFFEGDTYEETFIQ
jgi:hypothetical protein